MRFASRIVVTLRVPLRSTALRMGLLTTMRLLAAAMLGGSRLPDRGRTRHRRGLPLMLTGLTLRSRAPCGIGRSPDRRRRMPGGIGLNMRRGLPLNLALMNLAALALVSARLGA